MGWQGAWGIPRIWSIQAGTAGAPSLAIANDPNTGIWSPGANILAISTEGVERLRVNTTSVVLDADLVLPQSQVAGNTNGIFAGTSNLIRTFRPTASDGFNLFIDSAGNTTMAPGGPDTTLASYNVAIGASAFNLNTTGQYDVAVGYNALHANTTGQGCIAIGANALANNTTGNHNVGIGQSSLFTNTTGVYNIGIVADALHYNTTGSYNLALGYDALYANTTGAANVALGYMALIDNTTADGNVGIGFQALQNNTTGARNLGIGANALDGNTTGSFNVALGEEAGKTQTAANQNVTGSQNVWIGYQSGPGSTTQFTNAIAIGYRALNTASNQVVLGNASITTTILRGEVDFTGSTRTTIGANGAASALSANPVGYIDIRVGGSNFQVPYYNRGA